MNYTETNAAAIGTIGYASQAMPPDASPFHVMNNAANDAAALCSRIRSLADRLTGTAPTPIGDASGQKVTANVPPVFHALRMTAEQMQSDVQDAMRALDRIERALP